MMKPLGLFHPTHALACGGVIFYYLNQCYYLDMEKITLIFITICFLTQIIFWILYKRSKKKITQNKGGWLMRTLAIIIVGSFIFLREQITSIIPFFTLELWDYSLWTGILADVIVLLGMSLMIWSRITLGENWSANVLVKEKHELITKGPYTYVRHPIYSGLIMMILGIAIYSGSFSEVFLFVLFFFGAYYKGIKEERLLTKHFPEEYPNYKKQVKALIPFIF